MWERPPYHNQIEQKQTNIRVDGRYLLSTFSCRTLEILVLTSPSFGTKMIPRFCALHQRAICGAGGRGKQRCYNFTELLQLCWARH